MSLPIVSRAAWGAAPWRSAVNRVSMREKTAFLVHYHGGEPRHSVGVAVPREVEEIHLANGWSGIGYNFLVDLDGTIYEGRGWDGVGAQCPGFNRNGIGVYVAIGGSQKPTDAALRSVRYLYDEACRRTGNALRKMGHKDGFATSCPGPNLYAWVKAGMPAPGISGGGKGAPVNVPTAPKPKPKPSASLPAFPGVSRPSSRVNGATRAVQARLRARGWKIAVDGKHGPETTRVLKEFQRNKGLKVDGIAGPQTWAALWRLPIT